MGFAKPVQREERSTPRREKLAEVARRVREDAKKSTGRYLRSTEVPAGGE
jgi:hypothetical protein